MIALIDKKIEHEKGFEAVMELLMAKKPNDYDKVLEKLTGITKTNYNKEVSKLIQAEIKHLQS